MSKTTMDISIYVTFNNKTVPLTDLLKELLIELEDYKNRIDKTKEYIENLDKNAFETNDDVIVLDNYLNELLNILKGRE